MAPHTLSDGTRVQIRPIRVDDAIRLQAAHARLSPESRYRRFLGAKPILSTDDVRYLVEVDGADHFALVATASTPQEEAIIAVTRFVRLRDEPDAAEFAIVVADEYQRRGLASELLSRLAAAATERGIGRFRATALTENAAIVNLIDRLSEGRFESDRRGATTEFELTLPSGGSWTRTHPSPRSPPAGRAHFRRRVARLRSSPRAVEADRACGPEGEANVVRHARARARRARGSRPRSVRHRAAPTG